MARELGMNPKGFGKLGNYKQEPWKMPLSQFIEDLYQKRFGKEAAKQKKALIRADKQAEQTLKLNDDGAIAVEA